jgi:hypothetical protein
MTGPRPGRIVAVFTRDDVRKVMEAAAGHEIPASPLAPVFDIKTGRRIA